MWALDNMTPYAVERTCVLDRDGARQWIVVVKVTYTLEEGKPLELADEQVPPVLVPEFSGEDGASSLLYDTELSPSKPGTDVLVHGVAYAPGGTPATSTVVSLLVGDRRKVLRVEGERLYERDVSGEVLPGPPKPFVSTPFVYEDAYGGYDNRDPDPRKHVLHGENPVGVGVALSKASLVGTPAPRVQVVEGDKKAAAGFGPTASHWAPRVAFAGTYDGRWFETRKPLLPEDYDPRVHMCAPTDQQFTPHLRGGTPFRLINLSPSGALAFVLPKHYFVFETSFGRGPAMQHRAKLHTVTVEPEQKRLMLAFHSCLECHARYDDLDATVIRELEYIEA